jgi:hypothetical protein
MSAHTEADLRGTLAVIGSTVRECYTLATLLPEWWCSVGLCQTTSASPGGTSPFCPVTTLSWPRMLIRPIAVTSSLVMC